MLNALQYILHYVNQWGMFIAEGNRLKNKYRVWETKSGLRDEKNIPGNFSEPKGIN